MQMGRIFVVTFEEFGEPTDHLQLYLFVSGDSAILTRRQRRPVGLD